RPDEGYRHIKPYEIAKIWKGSKGSEQVLTHLLLSHFIKNDFFPIKKEHCLGTILLNVGLRREGSTITLFHDIDDQIIEVREEAFSPLQGWRWQDEIKSVPEGKAYAVDRLFEKFSKETLTIRHCEKANCDMIEDLFGMTFEELPILFQDARIKLPHDIKKADFQSSVWGKALVWPLALEIYIQFTGKNAEFRISRLQFISTPSGNDAAIPVKK
ncbi:MAG: hypothetical protein AAB870_01305, partial [Patescibacteria group bacterium]